MTIKKLPSGSYRVQKQINGKRHSFTFDHKPTQKEINAAINNASNAVNGKLTFRTASESYINARSKVLSPATVREYKGTLSRLSDSFSNTLIDNITTNMVQLEINKLSENRAPKTVRNYHGFIASVLGEFRQDLHLHTKLPMKEKKEVYIPKSEDVKAILNEAKGTNYELPILLACAGMRRGEICALTESDIEGNIIHINKDMVLDENKKWVIKPPKTTESTRDIVVPDVIINLIREKGLYKGHPSNITDYLHATEKKLGLQKFSIHKLRHYFASEAHAQGISDADIMKAGGWSTDYVMKSVYRHSLEEDNSKATSAVFAQLF